MAPYPFVASMRLEVEDPTLDTAPRNLIPNATGGLGAYGWITPVGGTVTALSLQPDPGELELKYVAGSPSAPSYFYTLPVPVTAGQQIAAWWSASTFGTSGTYYRGRVEYLNSAQVLAGSSAITSYLAHNAGGSVPSFALPAGAAYARLRFDLYSNNAGANPLPGDELSLKNLRMISQAGAITVGVTVQNAPIYRNLLTSATSITVEREPLNVGTLTASIPDATYDPATTTLLRTGRLVRLTAANASASQQVLFSGKVSSASVKYDPKKTTIKRAQISLTVVDAIADLANVSRPEGVATVGGLRQVLEGAGVPWLINGASSQIATVPVITRNESASALDQVAVTRDSVRGYAWLDRFGRLVANDPGNMPTSTAATFTESTYGDDLDVTFDSESVINLVTIKHLRLNAASGETVEVPYGPFRHEPSIREWGPRSAEFTIQGLTDTAATMKTFADAVFASSAVPQVLVNTMTFRVGATSDVGATRALLDLYDKVRVTNANGLDQTARVTSIRHRITPKNWLVDLTFGRDGGTAAPQVTPALVSQPTTPAIGPTVWTALTIASGFTANAVTPEGRIDGEGNVHLRGIVNVGSGVSGDTIFTLPAGFRPVNGQWSVPVRTNVNSATARLLILATGVATINWSGTAPTAFGLETVFSTA